MNNVARNHHYVPQFYLRGFLDPDLKKEQLNVIDKVGRRRFPANPRKIAVKCDFNRVNILGQPIDQVEKIFAEMDGEVARVLKYVIENETLPTDADMKILIYFVALLYMHNPQIRSHLEDTETMVRKRFARVLLSRPELYEAYRQQQRTVGKELPKYEEMQQFVESENYDIRYGHGHHLRYELESIDNVVLPLLSQREWSLFIAEESASDFVCSDRPVALVSIGDPPKDPDHPYNFGGPGLAQSDTELTMPLNRRMVLFAVFGGSSYTGTVDEMTIACINKRTIDAAARQIYCSNLDFKFLDNGVIKSGRDLVDE